MNALPARLQGWAKTMEPTLRGQDVVEPYIQKVLDLPGSNRLVEPPRNNVELSRKIYGNSMLEFRHDAEQNGDGSFNIWWKTGGEVWFNWGKEGLLSKLATPCLILGLILALMGAAAAVTTITGWHIPELDFILKNIPLSLTFSLMTIRAGLHTMYAGVQRSLRNNRKRQDTLEAYRHSQIEKMLHSDVDQNGVLKMVAAQNGWFSNDLRLHSRVDSGEVFGKKIGDRVTGRAQIADFVRRDVGNDLDLPLPVLTQDGPPREDVSPELVNQIGEKWKGMWDTWYNKWYEALPTIGTIDMALGQVMLLCAIASFVLLVLPAGTVPPGLEVMAHDPYLSVAFAFLLIANWVNCSLTGSRMLSFHEREERRAEFEEKLVEIDLRLQREKLFEYYTWRMQQLDRVSQQILTNEFQLTLELLPKAKTDFRRKVEPKAGAITRFLTDLKVTKLAPFSIIAGVAITLIGATLLVLTLSGNIPSQFSFLAKNTPVSILFTLGMVVAGLHATHRGASMSEKLFKKKLKDHSKSSIDQLLDALPAIKEPKDAYAAWLERRAPPRVVAEEVQVAQVERKYAPAAPVAIVQPVMQAELHQLEKKGYAFWINTLEKLCYPDLVLGLGLLVCAVAGLVTAFGGRTIPFFDFVAKDPSFSMFFCFNLLGVSLDALNTSWRMKKYLNRKADDKHFFHALDEGYRKLLSDRAAPL